MRLSILVPLLSLTLAACAGSSPPALSAAPASAIPFTAVMDSAFFGRYMRFQGVAEQQFDTLVVRVDSSQLLWPGHTTWPFDSPPYNEVVSVALGHGRQEGRWNAGEASEAVPVSMVRDGERLALRPGTTFRIPLRRGTDLRKRWLVFVFTGQFDVPDGRVTTGNSYAHSAPYLVSTPRPPTGESR
jgi:hypothetical protein